MTKYLMRLFAIAVLVALVDVCKAGDVEIGPVVSRPAAAGVARVWPVYASSGGGDEIRSCGWWRDGWRDFVDRKAMAMARRHGCVWVHNPGGVVSGQAMRFQQFTEASQQAALTGNETLKKVADWEEFSRQMSRLAEVGELMVYLGCPATMPLEEGETDDEWFARALRELKPVFDIEPKPLVGFDATYGHPADASRAKYSRFGGPEGLIARVIDHLNRSGYEVIVEPNILASAGWLRDRAGVCSTDWYFDSVLKNRDVRVPHHVRAWGSAFKPTELRGRQIRLLNLLWKKPIEEQRATVDAALAAGYDVALGVGSELLEPPGG